MKKLLKQYFGYDTFRPLQEKIIADVTRGHDTFVLMPTGGGKSICYQLPALMAEGLTLVISPLISLMKDQVDALQANGIPAGLLNSSLTYSEMMDVRNDIVRGNIKILYVAPERLSLDSFRNLFNSVKISLFAIDEAHCISEWGHDFRPAYGHLRLLKQQFPHIPIIALTATATPRVRADIVNQLGLVSPQHYVSSFDRANLELRVTRKKNALQKLVSLLKGHAGESVIIYCFSRKETGELTDQLNRYGFKAVAYHAGLDRATRQERQDQFIKDEVQIMAATIAFGMGIDKPDVRLIVHYSFPKSMEGYYQEIGRAGRDGLKSKCVLFYSYGDSIKHQYFIDQIDDEDLKKITRKKMQDVMDYCEGSACRRTYVLRYFGESYPHDNCKGCDVCLTPTVVYDATNVTRKILACVNQTGSRFGSQYIVDILRGGKNRKVLNNGHDALKVYGAARDESADELKQIIKALIEQNFLKVAEGTYPTLSVARQAVEWFKDKQSLELKRKVPDDLDQQSPEPKLKVHDVSETRYDIQLFQRLRKLRKEVADTRGVPPFIILGDVALRDMACHYPTNKEQFLQMRGVGQKKLEDLGDAFMQEIKHHLRDHGRIGG